MRLIEAMAAGLLVAEVVGVPERDGFAVAQQGAGDFARAVEARAGGDVERRADGGADGVELGRERPVGGRRGLLFRRRDERERRHLGCVVALGDEEDFAGADLRGVVEVDRLLLRDGEVVGVLIAVLAGAGVEHLDLRERIVERADQAFHRTTRNSCAGR